MTLRRWLPDPPDMGRFRFRDGGPSPGGMAHDPGDPHRRMAFFVPGSTLPDGWVWGAPPPMDTETWSRRARDEQDRLRRERGPSVACRPGSHRPE